MKDGPITGAFDTEQTQHMSRACSRRVLRRPRPNYSVWLSALLRSKLAKRNFHRRSSTQCMGPMLLIEKSADRSNVPPHRRVETKKPRGLGDDRGFPCFDAGFCGASPVRISEVGALMGYQLSLLRSAPKPTPPKEEAPQARAEGSSHAGSLQRAKGPASTAEPYCAPSVTVILSFPTASAWNNQISHGLNHAI